MFLQDSLLVTLVKLVDQLPIPALPARRGRGHPRVYPDRLFLKALVIMIARHLHIVHELLSVSAQPTTAMLTLRVLLSEQERFPSRRTWERRQFSGYSNITSADRLFRPSAGQPDPATGHF